MLLQATLAPSSVVVQVVVDKGPLNGCVCVWLLCLQPMKATPGSHGRPARRAVLPTSSSTHTHVDNTSTDMTSEDDDDDDSSVQSTDSSAGGGHGDPSAIAHLPNGGSFDGAFAAFNIGQH